MAESYIESIDNAITLFLRRSGKTQDQLADEMGVSTVTLMNKRKGLTDFKLSELVMLSKIVELSLDELTGLNPSTDGKGEKLA